MKVCANGTLRRHSIFSVSACVSVLILSLGVMDTASAEQYTAGHKFRRGVSNMTLGVLAIPGQMTVQTRKKGWAVGLPLGFAQGVGWMVATEAIGVWEFLTCPFEFPPRFRPIMAPEYPWDSFQEGHPGAGLR